MSSLQKSVWSSDLPLTINYHQSSNTDTNSSVNYNHWNTDLETNENRKRRSDKISAESCSCIRCFIIGLLLGGIALAILITFWLTSSNNSTTSTVSTTTIIANTSSTVSTTTTILASTMSTVSTMTSITTSTTIQTPTTTSTAITIPPPCPTTSIGSSSVIYNASSGNPGAYSCYAFLWTSTVTGLVTIAFQLQNQPSNWLLDDISVNNGTFEMLSNGGFENGVLSPWIRTNPYGSCGGTFARIDNSTPHTGIYDLLDSSNNCQDQISQNFSVTSGQIYTISFWAKVSAAASNTPITVLIF